MKTKSGKNLFKKLNERSKELQVKQEVIAKRHNLLIAQCDELEHLKNNMNDYLGKGKTEKKKESVIGAIRKHRSEERANLVFRRKSYAMFFDTGFLACKATQVI